jgi:hypothetical protein
MRRFTLLFCAVVSLILVLFLGFNLAIDPYDVLHGPRRAGVNLEKTQRDSDGRRVQVGFGVLRPWRTVLFGNSRILDGLDHLEPPWGGATFNAGMPSGNAFEIGRAMTLSGRSGVDCVVLGLELTDYDAITKVKGSFWISPLLDGSRGFAALRMGMSRQTFTRALATLADNASGRPDAGPWPSVYRPGEQRRRFYLTAEDYWRSLGGYAYDLERARFVEAIADRLTRRGIQVIAVFTPTHAFATEALYRTGADRALFAWRRELVTGLNRFSGRTPRAACAPGGAAVVWDFSGFQAFSEAPFPAPGQTAPHPSFYETEHFTPRTGAEILARIAGRPVAEPAPFGVVLTPESLTAADRAMLARRSAWLATAQGREAERFYADLARRARPRPLSQRFYLAKADWKALDRDLPSGRK